MVKKMAQSFLLTLLMVFFMSSGAIADRISYFDSNAVSRASRTTGLNHYSRLFHATTLRSTPVYDPAFFTVYTDRTLFQTALLSFNMETFESSALIGDLTSGATASQTFSYFTASSTPPAIKILGITGGEGSFNNTPCGAQYL